MNRDIIYALKRFFLLLIYLSLPLILQAQNPKGTVERIKVYGQSLEGNLAGDSPNRDVSVYLPPGYHENPDKRYPVIYFLHGYTDNDAKVFGLEPHWMNMAETLDKAFQDENIQEMIMVTPNAFTRFSGSMYSASVTIGNWEEYIAHELVAYIDEHYRTLPSAESRGLSGHSMGGYGALRIGQKYPDVFSSLYLLSPCCLEPAGFPGEDPDLQSAIDAVKDFDDLKQANFFVKAAFASGAAWSPNPDKPPFYLDLPYENGESNPLVIAKWNANRPLATLDQHIFNIRKLNAIAFDAGADDRGIAQSIKILDQTLDNYGVDHFYEEYDGDHLNRIAERMGTNVLVFFTENLAFE